MVRVTTCPVCNRVVREDEKGEARYFPFCSDRCRLIDLNRWFEGRYAIVEQLDEVELELRLNRDGEPRAEE
ncbi:MAG: DNA gyrase inhibitor YacG [Planctomycetota bacterium]|nr:MAG: DNA gyrase inhibitor YacG [Planctomycetota bacterium]